MTYPWVEDPDRPERFEPRGVYPWHDEELSGQAGGADASQPSYRPGGEQRVQMLRRIDPWSALKVSLVLYLSFFAVALVVGTGLWVIGRQMGFIADIESWIEVLGAPGTFHFRGQEILVMCAILGPIFAVLAALATTAAVAVYNVVARVTGGIEVTVKDSV